MSLFFLFQFVLSLLIASVGSFPVSVRCVLNHRTTKTATQASYLPRLTSSQRPASQSSSDVEDRLISIAKRLKLEVFDLDEGIFGFSTRDSRYGLEVVKTNIDVKSSDQLGLVLTELAGSGDGRGLVLVEEIYGSAAKATEQIQIGDVITGVIVGDTFRERTTGLNYDRTVQIIGKAKESAAASGSGSIMLELNRLVERAPIKVEVEDEAGDVTVIDALAGENLRKLLMRKGLKIYDRKTKRFDMPFARGDCAGEGLCGTCLVDIKEGQDSLNPKDNLETMITKDRPLSWRASCRAVVGSENKPGKIRLRLKPQSVFEDELNRGVKPLSG